MEESADSRWMKRALELAHQADEIGEVPVGAVIVLEGEIIGEGFNQPISSNDPSAHAEIVALRAAGQHQNNYRLPESTLYVTIEPCTMCIGALVHARVKTLIFGAREPRAGAAVSQLHLDDCDFYNHKVLVREGVLKEECTQVMKDFFKNRR